MKRGIVIAGPAHYPEKHQQSLDWIAPRAGFVEAPDAAKTLTLTHVIYDEQTLQAEILCVVALTGWTQHTCEAHIASDGSKRWATREFCHAVYDLAFNECKRSRINFLVAPDNLDAVRMHEKLGHQRIAVLEDAYGEGQDLILYGLTRKQWMNGRFAKPNGERNGQLA